MKRKYLAVLMTALISSSVFITGCGSVAEAPAQAEEEEEDEDDDHHGRDEDDDDEDDEEKKPVIVDIIDDKTLDSQINVLMDNLNVWEIDTQAVESYSGTRYWVSDLDHDGRIEICTNSHLEGSYDADNRIYEINEDGSGLEEIKIEMGGIEVDHPSLDFEDSNYSSVYFDKDTGRFHYILADYFTVSNEYSSVNFVDFTLGDDKASGEIFCYDLTFFSFDENPDSTLTDTAFFTKDGEVDEEEYFAYKDSYPEGKVKKEQMFGSFDGPSAYSYYIPALSDMSRAELKELLISSYKVFTGELDFFDFRMAVNEYNDDNGLMISGEMLTVAVGKWGLFKSDTEGDVNYYDSSSEDYVELEVDSNGVITLTSAGDDTMPDVVADLYCNPDGTLYAEYVVDEDAGDYFLKELDMVVIGIEEDNVLELSVTFWGNDGYLGGSEWYFERISY